MNNGNVIQAVAPADRATQAVFGIVAVPAREVMSEKALRVGLTPLVRGQQWNRQKIGNKIAFIGVVAC